MTEGKNLHIVYHEDPDILEVIYKNNSEAAVDEYVDVLLDYVDRLRQANKLDRPLLIIVDLTDSGMFPLIYGTSTVSKILPRLEDVSTMRLAYITDSPEDRFAIKGLGTLSSTRKQDTRTVFRSEERDAAIGWLLSNKET
jgi:hypothetical protein